MSEEKQYHSLAEVLKDSSNENYAETPEELLAQLGVNLPIQDKDLPFFLKEQNA